MNGFNAFAQKAAPLMLGIGAQASGRDPLGIAKGAALMQANQERDKRKAAIDNLMSGMGISGPQRDFISSLPPDMQAQWAMQQMAPQDPVRGVTVGDRLVNPITGEVMASFGPEPLPPEVIASIWGEDAGVRPDIFAGESGGDYNALFGYSNRKGGAFEGVNLTDMTVDEAIDFSNPQGEYGQWVKGNIGRVATPMGAYQVVGTTLREAKDALGLNGDEKMTPAMQERIGKWVFDKQGTGAWEGYTGPAKGGGKSAKVAALEKSVEAYEKAYALGMDVSRLDPVYKRKVKELNDLTSDPIAAKKAQALEAGLVPGTPEWQKFFMPTSTNLTVKPDGSVEFSQGAGGKPMTEMQSRLELFGGMMGATSPEIDALEEKWNPANLRDNAAGRMGWAGNYMRSEDAQKYETLGLAWAEGALRMSTGAAATEPEIIRVFKTYFAQPGDSPATIELKREQRKRFEASLQAASGKPTDAAPEADLPPVDLQGSDRALFEKYGVPIAK